MKGIFNLVTQYTQNLNSSYLNSQGHFLPQLRVSFVSRSFLELTLNLRKASPGLLTEKYSVLQMWGQGAGGGVVEGA